MNIYVVMRTQKITETWLSNASVDVLLSDYGYYVEFDAAKRLADCCNADIEDILRNEYKTYLEEHEEIIAEIRDRARLHNDNLDFLRKHDRPLTVDYQTVNNLEPKTFEEWASQVKEPVYWVLTLKKGG